MSRVLIYIFAGFLLVAGIAFSNDDCFPGMIEVFDNDNIIQMPWKVKGLFFGPYYGRPAKDSVHAWKFIAGLKIDSINFGDGFVPLKDASDLDSVAILSDDLIDFLMENRIYYIIKEMPWFKKSDTITWDWRGLPQKRKDLTKLLKFRFDRKINVDTILISLRKLELNLDAGCIPIARLE